MPDLDCFPPRSTTGLKRDPESIYYVHCRSDGARVPSPSAAALAHRGGAMAGDTEIPIL
jgi:hypothetical protein